MKEIEQLLKKIKKISKDKQAQYWWGVEFSDHAKPDYKARLLYSKRLESVIFAADSPEKLCQKLQQFIDSGNVKDAVVAYLEAQIQLEKSAIRTHENLIKEYNEKENENSSS